MMINPKTFRQAAARAVYAIEEPCEDYDDLPASEREEREEQAGELLAEIERQLEYRDRWEGKTEK